MAAQQSGYRRVNWLASRVFCRWGRQTRHGAVTTASYSHRRARPVDHRLRM